MKPWRIPLLAALIAALFVLAPVAFADCPPGNPECELLPPESEEVNPDPGSGVGLAGEVASPGSFLPVQVVIPMPLPRQADASPVRVAVGVPASVPGIEIPLRYQNPDDVSCGVQALGMALDGLEGAAPTSQALLGFLQDQGMMYDFGTGVEELAYAAQSFGYRGSYAFHGASLEDLAAQLAAGSPAVVSLGANGEGVPGHFVTVTGISPDGKWVSYNDPTLGRQVISANEFTRLWGLQGNSGVAVLKDVPASAPDYSPWVALMAGVMALVSMTPLGARRQGVGGRVDSGGGGGKPAPKPAPKAAPKPAPKPAPKTAPKPAPKPAPAPAPKPSMKEEKYGAEPAIAPAPKPTPAPKPAPAPRARFDEEPAPAPAPKAPAVATPVPRARFDEEPPAPAPSLFGQIAGAIFDAASAVSAAVRDTVSSVSTAVRNTVSQAASAIQRVASPIAAAVSNQVRNAALAVEKELEDLAGLTRHAVTVVRSAITEVPPATSGVVQPRPLATPVASRTPRAGATPTPTPMATRTPAPDTTPVPPVPRMATDPGAEDRLSWLDGLRRVIASPDTLFNAATDDNLLTWLRNAPRGIPDLVVTLPILRGLGLDDMIGPITRTYDGTAILRTVGRTVGDVGATPLLLTGYALTIGPNLVENIADHASWSNTRGLADPLRGIRHQRDRGFGRRCRDDGSHWKPWACLRCQAWRGYRRRHTMGGLVG